MIPLPRKLNTPLILTLFYKNLIWISNAENSFQHARLTVEKANKSDHLADYLDLTFVIDGGGKLSTRLYDKRDDFDFHIVNFAFLSSNIPSGPS